MVCWAPAALHRYYIALNSHQIPLCTAVLAVGKPTVLTLINGGIIAIDDLKDQAPAILEVRIGCGVVLWRGVWMVECVRGA
jgi:hypothetical protein